MDPVTLSKLLGYANASITLDKYGHSFESQKRAGMELMGSLYEPAMGLAERPASAVKP